MPHEIAYHLLVAEASAWPIGSMCAFEERTTVVARPGAGVLDARTQVLADQLESRLRPRAGGLSLEVLRQLRDGAWFGPTENNIDVIDHLVRVAQRFLQCQGGTVTLREKDPHDPTDEVDLWERAGRWRWLSLLLPADLLVSAIFAARNSDPTCDQVTLTTPHLRQVLDAPLPAAETHLHVGAAMPFTLLWTGLMHALGSGATAEARLAELRDLPFGSAAGYHEMALGAAIVRLLLHAFLEHRASAGGTFEEFQGGPLATLSARLTVPAAGPVFHARLLRLLQRLRVAGTGALAVAGLRYLYGRLARPPRLRSNPCIADVILADPLTAHTYGRAEWRTLQRGGLIGGVGLPETRFAARAIAYLRGAGRPDAAFRLLFLQYLRIRCATFRYLIEEPGTAGMDWFSRHYHRVSPLRGPVDLVKYETALRTDAANLRLGALEARTAPAPNWNGVRDEVWSFARQAGHYVPPTGQTRPEIGLILHFIKKLDYGLPDGSRRLHADPRLPNTARFVRWYREQRTCALAIIGALRRNPELLVVLRGIDIANLELAIPLWPSLPLLQDVRRASVEVATVLARRRPHWQVPPLRVTQHAGEDFRRLVEGLRHIHEAAEFGLLSAGDRIGHGIALGTDAGRWASRARIVAQPAEERLDDLLWELSRYGEGVLPTDAGRVEQVRAEAVRLARYIYRDGVATEPSIDLLLEARRLRHHPAFLRNILRYPEMGPQPQQPVHQLVWRYLCDAGVFSRGLRPVDVVSSDGEVAMLTAAQRWLRRLFGQMEITVETNPSSNQIIGDMVALEEHPAFRMRPLPGRAEPDGGSLLISINVDNPITFASCLADEYAHIYYALLRAGIASHVALEWLEGVRACGWRSRFTLPATTDLDNCLAKLGPRRWLSEWSGRDRSLRRGDPSPMRGDAGIRPPA